MHIVIFCETLILARDISREIVLGICDHVNGRTNYAGMRIEIDSKNIRIDIRHADIEKTIALRPDYVLFYDTSVDFDKEYERRMYGRYKELKSVKDVIELVIGK